MKGKREYPGSLFYRIPVLMLEAKTEARQLCCGGNMARPRVRASRRGKFRSLKLPVRTGCVQYCTGTVQYTLY